jgi:hypothetical protein
MKALGQTTWVIPGGHIPLRSSGPEPEFTSRDELFLLNTGDRPAKVEMVVFYADREPVGGYELGVQARRVRSVRFNDLIDPEALLLDIDFGVVITSDVPIVVQFTRVDTSRESLAMLGLLAFPANG